MSLTHEEFLKHVEIYSHRGICNDYPNMESELTSYLNFQEKNVNIFIEKYMEEGEYIGKYYKYTVGQLMKHITAINPQEENIYLIARLVHEWLHTND